MLFALNCCDSCSIKKKEKRFYGYMKLARLSQCPQSNFTQLERVKWRCIIFSLKHDLAESNRTFFLRHHLFFINGFRMIKFQGVLEDDDDDRFNVIYFGPHSKIIKNGKEKRWSCSIFERDFFLFIWQQ